MATLTYQEQLQKLQRLKKIHLDGKVVRMEIFKEMQRTEHILREKIREESRGKK